MLCVWTQTVYTLCISNSTVWNAVGLLRNDKLLSETFLVDICLLNLLNYIESYILPFFILLSFSLIILQSCIFPSDIFQSCCFQPCSLVRQIPVLLFSPSFSIVLHFLVLHFQRPPHILVIFDIFAYISPVKRFDFDKTWQMGGREMVRKVTDPVEWSTESLQCLVLSARLINRDFFFLWITPRFGHRQIHVYLILNISTQY